METQAKTILTVFTIVNAPVAKVWEFWTKPEHIVNWNHASDDWRTPKAQNDLREGGKFCWRMEAKDGSMGFDFEGTFDKIQPLKRIQYTLDDGRKVSVAFNDNGTSTNVTEFFEAENTNPLKLQKERKLPPGLKLKNGPGVWKIIPSKKKTGKLYFLLIPTPPRNIKTILKRPGPKR